jgi:hypothetical protein
MHPPPHPPASPPRMLWTRRPSCPPFLSPRRPPPKLALPLLERPAPVGCRAWAFQQGSQRGEWVRGGGLQMSQEALHLWKQGEGGQQGQQQQLQGLVLQGLVLRGLLLLLLLLLLSLQVLAR